MNRQYVLLSVVQFQPVYFFPYEILIIVLVISVFILIYIYLGRSLNPKKDRYIADIERKILKENISAKRDGRDIQLDRILEKYSWMLSPPTTLSPTAAPVGVLKDKFYEMFDYDKNRKEAFLGKLDLFERKIVIDSVSEKRLDEIKNRKSKFRLRDLQKISEKPGLLNQIYEERITEQR